MGLWESPVELFFWDGRLSIRDAKKKTVFYLDIDNREYWAVKKLREEIGPKLVEMMNNYNIVPITANQAVNSTSSSSTYLDASKSNGNGSNLHEDKPRNPWGRKGKPK